LDQIYGPKHEIIHRLTRWFKKHKKQNIHFNWINAI